MIAPVHRRRPAPPRVGRSPVRRWAETRGVVGGHRRPARRVELRADDGVRVAASLLEGPGPDAVVVAPGFAARRSKPAYAYLADELSRDATVLALDLRGHGGSGGTSTLGDREALDVAAAAGWLRANGAGRVVLLGLSMGATAVLHAADRGAPADALVCVSAPAVHRRDPDSAPMRRLQTVWGSRWGRLGLRLGLGVRVVAPGRWRRPPHPVELAARLRVPLLVVHGRDDGYFPVGDARRLAAAAGGPASLWIRPEGFGHAEDGVTARFVTALAGALRTVRRTGAFPAAPPTGTGCRG